MFPKDQTSTALNNPFKRPSSNYTQQRPQTPVNNLTQNTYAPNKPLTPNKSFGKLPGYNQIPQQYNNQRSNLNISKSRVSVNSSQSQLAFLNQDHADIFPEDLVFLLKN